jgi:putative glutamine amidotransferase
MNMTKPLIGVLGIKMPKPVEGQKITMDYVNEAYNKAIIRAGGVPFLMPVLENPTDADELLAMCDGILFPGGADVDPKFFGEDPHIGLGKVYKEWDAFWLHALDYALAHKIPVLGICRGMQLIDIGLHGSVYQDIKEYRSDPLTHAQPEDRSYPIHPITIKQGTLFHKIIGTDKIFTNSFHHQVIHKIGDGLTVSAQTSDGVIEAMENADGSILLVQFHPEELQDSVPETRNIFKHLVDMAAAHHK